MVTTAATSLGEIRQLIKSTHDYLDVVQIWLRRPLSEADLLFLKNHSGDLKRARQLRTREPARWNRRYKQMVRLCQPDADAIKFLAKRNDVLMTYVELAHDLIFPDGKCVKEMLRLTPIHFVQRWHGKRKATIFPNGNYRTGGLKGRGTVSILRGSTIQSHRRDRLLPRRSQSQRLSKFEKDGTGSP